MAGQFRWGDGVAWRCAFTSSSLLSHWYVLASAHLPEFCAGLRLFFICISAVVVREIARLMMAAYFNLKLRAVLLLPIGGLFAYANPESQEGANQGLAQFAMALIGPAANSSRR